MDTGQVGAVDQVGLDREVLVDEVRPVGVVGVDAADLGGGDDHHVGPVLLKPAKGRPLVGEVQLVACRGEDLGRVAALLKPPNNRRTDHPTVAGDKDTS